MSRLAVMVASAGDFVKGTLDDVVQTHVRGKFIVGVIIIGIITNATFTIMPTPQTKTSPTCGRPTT